MTKKTPYISIFILILSPLSCLSNSTKETEQSLQDAQQKIAHIWIEEGSFTQIKNNKQEPQLHTAVHHNKANIVRLLLKQGADGLFINTKKHNQSLMHLSISRTNDPTVLKLLLAHHPDLLHKKNLSGEIPLHTAARHQRIAAISTILKDASCKPHTINQQDNNGQTALLMALANNNAETAHLLLNHGANPDLPDKQGNTPLHLVAQSGDSKMATAIIEKTACLMAKNDQNETAYDIACKAGNTAVAELLSHAYKEQYSSPHRFLQKIKKWHSSKNSNKK